MDGYCVKCVGCGTLFRKPVVQGFLQVDFERGCALLTEQRNRCVLCGSRLLYVKDERG